MCGGSIGGWGVDLCCRRGRRGKRLDCMLCGDCCCCLEPNRTNKSAIKIKKEEKQGVVWDNKSGTFGGIDLVQIGAHARLN